VEDGTAGATWLTVAPGPGAVTQEPTALERPTERLDVRVPFRRLGVAVSEGGPDDLLPGAHRRQLAPGRVSTAVRGDATHAGFLAQGGEPSVDDVVPERPAVLAGEQQGFRFVCDSPARPIGFEECEATDSSKPMAFAGEPQTGCVGPRRFTSVRVARTQGPP